MKVRFYQNPQLHISPSKRTNQSPKTQFGQNKGSDSANEKKDKSSTMRKGWEGIKSNLLITLGSTALTAIAGAIFPPLLVCIPIVLGVGLATDFIKGTQQPNK